jgi:hypothetical protein
VGNAEPDAVAGSPARDPGPVGPGDLDGGVPGGSVTDGSGAGGSPSAVDRVTGSYRAVAGFVNRRALARATRPCRGRSTSWDRHCCGGGGRCAAGAAPVPRLAAQVAMDEALLAMAMTPRRFPLPGDYARVARELADAEALYVRNGWIDDPAPTIAPRLRCRRRTSRRAGAGPWATITTASAGTAASPPTRASPAATGGWRSNRTALPRRPYSSTRMVPGRG